MTAVETRALTKYYGKSMGIEGVSISIDEGEIYGFIGPNGAGKSTTIRTLLGFLRPTSGSAEILGMDIVKQTRGIKQSIGYLPSEVNFYRELTVRQFLDYSAGFYNLNDKAYMKKLIEAFEISQNKKISSLSLGNRKKVGIVQCLMHKPRLAILDEPTSGLDPLMQNRFFEVLEEVNRQGTTVFFSSHLLNEVQRLCHRVAIIKEGRIVRVESVGNLREKALKTVTVKFREKVTKESLERLGVKKISEYLGGYRMYAAGDIEKLLYGLLELKLEDITVEEPSLEEVFMQYYE